VKRCIMLLLVICALSVVAFSQAAVPASAPVTAQLSSAPAAEIYGGFQWESFDLGNFVGLPGVSIPRQNFLGFRTSTNVKVYRWLGAEGEFSRDSKSYKDFAVSGDKLTASTITAMGGPRLTYHAGRVAPFAHVLLGVYRFNATYTDPTIGTGSSSVNAFAFAFGGGASFRVSRHFGIATTADYTRPSKYGTALNNISLTVGPVFYFGGSKGEVASYTPAPPPIAPAAPVAPPAPVAAPARVTAPAPVSERRCIQSMIDTQGNETCMRYANQQ
jgi:opacity protein-like surface antigen